MKPNTDIAIVDYGMGNTFSIQNACRAVGLQAEMTKSSERLLNADAVILPGVGAFAEAMSRLTQLNLIETIQEIATSNKPLVGICLGMQLLLSSSEEFGFCAGLDIIPGSVKKLKQTIDHHGQCSKIPHIGWAPVNQPEGSDKQRGQTNWQGSLLSDVRPGSSMYFVHSYFVEPDSDEVVLATSHYSDSTFCSALQYKNIIAFQFHPERSGQVGLTVYKNLARHLKKQSNS